MWRELVETSSFLEFLGAHEEAEQAQEAKAGTNTSSAGGVGRKTSATSTCNEDSAECAGAKTSVPGAGSSAASSKAGSPGRGDNTVRRGAAASPASIAEVSGGAKNKNHKQAAEIRAARARLQAQQARSNESVEEPKTAEVAAATKKGGSSGDGAAEACARLPLSTTG